MKQVNDLRGCQGARAGVFRPGENAKIIFGKQYDDSFYATACAYLLRRFGPAQRGCDPYKDLTQYVLTTEMEGVSLIIQPCVSVSTSFGYYLSPDIYESTMEAMMKSRQDRSDADEKDCPCRGPVIKALCEAMEELKKPVNVRDWFFNIVGRVGDGDLQYDNDGENIRIAEYSDLAGYGIVPEYFDRFKKS